MLVNIWLPWQRCGWSKQSPWWSVALMWSPWRWRGKQRWMFWAVALCLCLREECVYYGLIVTGTNWVHVSATTPREGPELQDGAGGGLLFFGARLSVWSLMWRQVTRRERSLKMRRLSIKCRCLGVITLTPGSFHTEQKSEPSAQINGDASLLS